MSRSAQALRAGELVRRAARGDVLAVIELESKRGATEAAVSKSGGDLRMGIEPVSGRLARIQTQLETEMRAAGRDTKAIRRAKRRLHFAYAAVLRDAGKFSRTNRAEFQASVDEATRQTDEAAERWRQAVWLKDPAMLSTEERAACAWCGWWPSVIPKVRACIRGGRAVLVNRRNGRELRAA